jgi:hypothetical protein
LGVAHYDPAYAQSIMRGMRGPLAWIRHLVLAGRFGGRMGRLFKAWRRRDFESAYQKATALLEFAKDPRNEMLRPALPMLASFVGQTAEKTGRPEAAMSAGNAGLDYVAGIRQQEASAKSAAASVSNPPSELELHRYELEFQDRLARMTGDATDSEPVVGPFPLDSA